MKSAAGHARAMRYSPPVRALVTGLLTTLLPCGWLYAFVITAAGTGHAAAGAGLMAVFWLGTLPVMTVIGAGVRKLAAPVAAKLPAMTAAAVVVVGLYTIVARAQVVLPAARAGEPVSAADMRARVQALPAATLPCCTDKGAP